MNNQKSKTIGSLPSSRYSKLVSLPISVGIGPVTPVFPKITLTTMCKVPWLTITVGIYVQNMNEKRMIKNKKMQGGLLSSRCSKLVSLPISVGIEPVT